MNYIDKHQIRIAEPLYDLVNNKILPGTDRDQDAFWLSLSVLLTGFSEENQALLDKRDTLQNQIDDWHRRQAGQPVDATSYQQFLRDIGYLLPAGEDFAIKTENVDPEIATTAGPQLVVPVNNARYALNAANARWGSLYDAFYGTDVIPESPGFEKGPAYNPQRGRLVVQRAHQFLDEAIPLAGGSYEDVENYALENQALVITLANGTETGLQEASAFCGYQGEDNLSALLFRHNGLYIQILFDPEHPVGKQHPAGVRDVILESAVTTIQDCEDSVTAVDAEDKVLVYRNWLGLMKGDLVDSFLKSGQQVTRRLNADLVFQRPEGGELTLPGRSLMLVRNVGHHMKTNAVLTKDGDEVFEGLLDAMLTSLIALHDLQETGPYRNSPKKSVYIVKPKMHGPEEVGFTVRLFAAVEKALQLPANTLKVGIMDEERRTTVNLKACIRAAQERLIFINTGFLDRTGDEIHTSMEAGPMIRKADMKNAVWINAYEDWNVDIGLACGLKGKAQIGKGMWAVPNEMANMLATKQGHPESGASCAWVPSPTAATLHAIHYHQVNVSAVQETLKSRKSASIDDILDIPLQDNPGVWSAEDIQEELNNNAQSILGYVVRWVDQGVGCSKVPDIHNVGLMEDRATLRISSQHIANWLHHGICAEAQVVETFRRMAAVVDEQNSNDPFYRPMAPAYDGVAFQSALALVLQGREQPNGYTEYILREYRLKVKAGGH